MRATLVSGINHKDLHLNSVKCVSHLLVGVGCYKEQPNNLIRIECVWGQGGLDYVQSNYVGNTRPKWVYLVVDRRRASIERLQSYFLACQNFKNHKMLVGNEYL